VWTPARETQAATPDLSAWYFRTSRFGLLVLVALAAYGFHTSLAGRPLLRDEILQA